VRPKRALCEVGAVVVLASVRVTGAVEVRASVRGKGAVVYSSRILLVVLGREEGLAKEEVLYSREAFGEWLVLGLAEEVIVREVVFMVP
jgi:hypothetical protein